MKGLVRVNWRDYRVVFQPEVQVIIIAHPSTLFGQILFDLKESTLIPTQNEVNSQLRVHVTSENPLVKSPSILVQVSPHLINNLSNNLTLDQLLSPTPQLNQLLILLPTITLNPSENSTKRYVKPLEIALILIPLAFSKPPPSTS
jgi:hypothetical protein